MTLISLDEATGARRQEEALKEIETTELMLSLGAIELLREHSDSWREAVRRVYRVMEYARLNPDDPMPY